MLGGVRIVDLSVRCYKFSASASHIWVSDTPRDPCPAQGCVRDDTACINTRTRRREERDVHAQREKTDKTPLLHTGMFHTLTQSKLNNKIAFT